MNREIKVFLASPSDLSSERDAFRETIDVLNAGFGDGAGVTFIPLGWEHDALAIAGYRSQDVINELIDECDVFVLALGEWWGQAADDSPYSSYTEEEYYRALDRFKREQVPTVFVFFKHVDAARLRDPGAQLKKVLDFQRHLEESHEVLYHRFADEREFQDEVDWHLRKYAKGELPKADVRPQRELVTAEQLDALRKAHEEFEKKLDALAAQNERLALGLAENAAKAANEGKIEEASQLFAQVVFATTNQKVLSLAFEFYLRTGNLDAAEDTFKQWTSAGIATDTPEAAQAYNNLGRVHRRRGEYDEAEEYHHQAIDINKKLGRRKQLAADYGSLAAIYRLRGELDQAEATHRKALAINKALGHKGGMSYDYGGLGNVYRLRGDVQRAREMHEKSLEIERELGREQRLAIALGVLGADYRRCKQPDLDKSEAYTRQSLEINEKLNRKEGIAIDYGNFGLIELERGNLEKAEEWVNKALSINKELSRQFGMAIDYGSLGELRRLRGDLENAEKMYAKALEINQRLRSREGRARDHRGLGLIAEARRETAVARDHLTKSRDYYRGLGMVEGAEEVQNFLERLPNE